MGSENQKIIIDEKNILRDKEITNIFPQSLIILGKLNEKEEEGLNLNK
jgi:diphthamide biosynthesis methyltransferase